MRVSGALMLLGATMGHAFIPSSIIKSGKAMPALSVSQRGSALFSTPKSEEKGGGHSVPGVPQEIDPELKRIQETLMEHQKNAARLTGAEEARTLVYNNPGFGVFSTNSKALEGYPAASMVAFAVDEVGRPIFSFSSISTHKHDVQADPKCSFTVAYKDFKGLDDGRVTLIGEASKVSDPAEVAAVREIYMTKHPGHFWTSFGDFDFFRMTDIKAVRYNGGFARFGALEPEDYLSAKPDPVSEYSHHVIKHMNDDHGDATAAMLRHYVGIPVDKADIVSIDRLGMYVKMTNQFGSSKVRVPFVRPVADRKDLKQIFVDMTNESAGARA